MSTKSHWQTTAKLARFPRLETNMKADVVVIGGGITGVTTAYLLAQGGHSVVLLERDRCGGNDTAHTTAHLTFATDLRMSVLVDRFGRDHAQAAWDAGRAAINQIDELVQREQIECDFSWVPGYLHAPAQDSTSADVKRLQKDANLAADLGFDAQFLDAVPFFQTAGVRIPNQARFHPLKYLAGLLTSLPAGKCHVFEGSEVTEVQDKPLAVKVGNYTVTCDYLVIGTHVPLQGKCGLMGAALFQSKLAPYTSYAIGAKVPRRTFPDALFWDTADPYHYARVCEHPRHQFLILGGQDHKTGQIDDPQSCYRALEKQLLTLVPKADIHDRWSGQVIETNDGLPFIGETAERQFVATGYSGNGMTFGTLAAMMACDAIVGRKNPWQALFDVSRKKLVGGAWDYVKENLDYPFYMIKDRLLAAEGKTLRGVTRGTGKILKLNGQRVAAYRDGQGKLTTLSPECTHLGCIVHWNSVESTWDCPCHGSRFKPTGEVLAGPAESALEKVPAEAGADS